MKVLLMHPDRDFDGAQPLPAHGDELITDLELGTMIEAMANDDPALADVARRTLLCTAGNDVLTVLYRQEVLKDCMAHPEVVRDLHALAIRAIEGRREHYFMGILHRYPSSVLSGSIRYGGFLMKVMRSIRQIAEAHAGQFHSRGFVNLFDLVQREFTDEYLARIQDHLSHLEFRDGVLVSAGLGEGLEGCGYVLRRDAEPRPRWLRWILGMERRSLTFHIHERDQAGATIVSQLRDRGVNLAANAMAQSVDHIASFFRALRLEAGFYVSCLNLRQRLESIGASTAFPVPSAAGSRIARSTGLYDICLALKTARPVVDNEIEADGMNATVITGANQGGKSSFLRAFGLAHTMMQAGMFVGAQSYAGELCAGVFTHFKRREDATMQRGKFDEELARMSAIVDSLARNSLVLLNESFGSTNEREGSEIARQVFTALVERGVRVVFVTHLHEFARRLCDESRSDILFLRAERLEDGTRTFKLVRGPPLSTSYGKDLYREVFAA